MRRAIWWVRRDLRLTDNQALTAALAQAGQVIPVFVLDPALLAAHEAAAKRVAFLLGGLRALDEALRARGSTLVVRRGNPRDELTALRADCGAEAIFAEADVWPYGVERDRRVEAALPLHLVGGLTVHPPEATLKANGQPYTVFTPFSRRWKALPPPHLSAILPAPERIPTPVGIHSLPIPVAPALSPAVPFPPGEAEAQRRLEAFVGAEDAPIAHYASRRDLMGSPGTSRLSPYLRFGMLSARQAVAAAFTAVELARGPRSREGAEAWLGELIWREFYQAILTHFPHVLEQSFRPGLQAIRWKNDDQAFAAWCEGRTGYPVVDAAMRELVETGWMHNRARMVAASFLVKDLLIDWRWGERFFMQHLVDGDPAANNGGWQWVASTGADAAPYFRIFNPILQGKKYDPRSAYVRRWVPELGRVPDRFIHQPWRMDPTAQEEAGCRIGRDYPPPIVDHAWARERTLVAYAHTRRSRA